MTPRDWTPSDAADAAEAERSRLRDQISALEVERDAARLERDVWREDCTEERERSAGLRNDLAEANERLASISGGNDGK